MISKANNTTVSNVSANKVAMVEPLGGHGGVEFYDLGLCEALSQVGYKVTLYTCTETGLDQKYNSKCDVRKVYKGIYGSNPKVIRGLRYLVGTLKAAFIAKKKKEAIAHFHLYEFSWRDFLNIVIFKLVGAKIVATVHDVELPVLQNKKNTKYRYFGPLVDRFVVHTDFTKRDFINVLPSVVGKVVRVTHVDTDFVYGFTGTQREARSYLDLNFASGTKVVLFFGQIKESKGLDVLLRAFSRIKESNSNVYLLIAGRAWRADLEKYRELQEQLGIADRVVQHIKYIPNEDVPAYFRAADVVVLPYVKVYNSGVVLRAMDYGAPVIVSDLEPFKEVVEEGVNGAFFANGDPESLADCLKKVLVNDDFLSNLRDAARHTIETKYSWEVVGKEMDMVYRGVVEK